MYTHMHIYIYIYIVYASSAPLSSLAPSLRGAACLSAREASDERSARSLAPPLSLSLSLFIYTYIYIYIYG